MNKMCWATDIHLNFASLSDRMKFYEDLNVHCSNILIITGDIADGNTIINFLQEIEEHVDKHVLFILGNHDFYQSSIERVRSSISSTELLWLQLLYVNIGNGTYITGVDSFADARCGNVSSLAKVKDMIQIEEYRLSSSLFDTMRYYADKDAEQLMTSVDHIMDNEKDVRKIIICCHIPPFEEVCMYNGRPTTSDYLPYFTSKVLGDTLLVIADKYHMIEFEVLCGHTHSEALFCPRTNMTVRVLNSQYGKPTFTEFLV